MHHQGSHDLISSMLYCGFCFDAMWANQPGKAALCWIAALVWWVIGARAAR